MLLTGNLQLTNRDEQSHINQYTETPALTGAGANRNQTSEFFANQSSLRTYYGDFLVNFDYDLTDDLSLKALVVTCKTVDLILPHKVKI
jgi:hypothetical protein